MKWILRYLRGTSDISFRFIGTYLKLQDYVDANLVGDVYSRKSTTRFIYTLEGTTMCWTSRLQKVVIISTTEAKYVAMTEVAKEMIWLQGFLNEMGKKNEKSVLYNDGQSVIFLTNNLTYHSRMKHIQLRYHFIRSLLEKWRVVTWEDQWNREYDTHVD